VVLQTIITRARRLADLLSKRNEMMGTRSVTYFHKASFDDAPFVAVYRQHDGYPTGMGDDIVKVLGSRQLVNGIQDHMKQVNGMNCAAALLVSDLKGDEAGSIYIYGGDLDAEGCWAEYIYHLAPVEGSIHLRCIGHGVDLYDGPLSKFDGKAAEKIESEAA
jgi:hypothetical protein